MVRCSGSVRGRHSRAPVPGSRVHSQLHALQAGDRDRVKRVARTNALPNPGSGRRAFVRFAIETLPQRTASPEEARAVLIAGGIITADGELAAEYRPAGDSGKLPASQLRQQRT
jgi:hypothetical protein